MQVRIRVETEALEDVITSLRRLADALDAEELDAESAMTETVRCVDQLDEFATELRRSLGQ